MSQLDVQSNIRSPRGWEQVVGQLQSAEDRASFLKAMLDLQCRIVAAEYGLMWEAMPGPPGVRVTASWPEGLQAGGIAQPVMAMLDQAARSGFQRGMTHTLAIRSRSVEGVESSNGQVFVTVLKESGRPTAVSTVVADLRDPAAIQATLPLRTLAAGLFEGFAARHEAAARSAEARRVRDAMALLAVAQEGRGFHGSAINTVNELCRQYGCERVSLGWVHGREVKLAAISDTDKVKRQTEEAALIETAMAECLDQQQPIVCPSEASAEKPGPSETPSPSPSLSPSPSSVAEDAAAPGGAGSRESVGSDAAAGIEAIESMLAQAVVFGHRKLLERDPQLRALSIPLRQGETWVGVLTFERRERAFASAEVRRLLLVADVLGPQLADRYESDRWVIGHAWRAIQRGASFAVGPRHVGWKLLAVAGLAAVAYVGLATWDYRVSASFRLEAMNRRMVPAPYTARLDKVYVRPGDTVKLGDPLAELDSAELRLQLEEARSAMTKAQVERDDARSKGKQSEAARAQAAVDQARARIDLLGFRLERATLRSPIDGRVLEGYWFDRLGRTIEQGDNLFELAPLDDLTAVVRISEWDVDQVQSALAATLADAVSGTTPRDPTPRDPSSRDPAAGPGLRGELATRAEPQRSFEITVERLVPLGQPHEGANVFELWCRIDRPEPWLRPGMEGVAKIEVGRRRLAWVLTHRIVDTVRLWLWW